MLQAHSISSSRQNPLGQYPVSARFFQPVIPGVMPTKTEGI
jgi:hypothetical protein